ncbi:MAG: ABC transporter permease [Armatimonadetes bacterium]|nr:ABC transporter permease [Armatimonadota bacterium]
MGDLWTCAGRELLRRTGRTFANVFGYLLATAMMVGLLSLLLFSKDAASGVLGSTGTHFIAFAPACTPVCDVKAVDAQNEGFVANGSETALIPAGAVEKVKRLSTVKDAAPYLSFRFKDPRDGHTFTVGGFVPGGNAAVATTCCAEAHIVAGRFLQPDDQGAAMLDEAYARSQDLHVGDKITIAGLPFVVAGIVNPGVRPARADVYMRFSDAERAITRRVLSPPVRHVANVLLVEVRSSRVQEQAIQSVKRLLPDTVTSTYACYKPAAQVMGMQEGTVWLLTLLLGLCAVVLALKSQLSSVIERRRDIGILKAIGWTDGNVVSLILTESILQALAGGALGCLVAAAILLLAPIKQLAGIDSPGPVTVSALVFLSGFALALLGGVIAGVVPALVAARQRPADSLRRV